MRFYTGATINTINVNVNRIFVFNHKEKHSHQARQVLLILLKCVFSVVGDFFFIDACSKSSENTFDTSALSQELSIMLMMMI